MGDKNISIYELIDFIKTVYNDIVSIEIDLRANSALLKTFSKESSYYINEKLKSFVEPKNIGISNVNIYNNIYDGYVTFFINWRNKT